MSLYVQRQNKDKNWVSDDYEFDTVEAAKGYAGSVGVGPEPCVLRVVDDQSRVYAWVPRNGWTPTGAAPFR